VTNFNRLSLPTFEALLAAVLDIARGKPIGESVLIADVVHRMRGFRDFIAIAEAERSETIRGILLDMAFLNLLSMHEFASADDADYNFYRSAFQPRVAFVTTELFAKYIERERPSGSPLISFTEGGFSEKALPKERFAEEHGVTKRRDETLQPAPRDEPNQPKPNSTNVTVFFATDRSPTTPASFGADRGEDPQPMTYGRAEVSIPNRHKKGHIEAPRWWRLEFRANPDHHMILVDVKSLDRASFQERIQRVTNKSGADATALVFVHGFATTFESAVMRTAQFAYDLEFKGPAFAYSWTSAGVLSLSRYIFDTNNVEWTIPHLRDFLVLLQKSGVQAIHIIAHSMGSQAVVASAIELASHSEAPALPTVVLAAPDIDRAIFLSHAPALTRAANNVTLYASSNDVAMRISQKVNGSPRAGDSEDILIHEGIDSIDASSIDTDVTGHQYFAGARPLLTDINGVIAGQPLPRFGLERVTFGDSHFWKFRA
jgi:esterase/lipase superfamily enzyme